MVGIILEHISNLQGANFFTCKVAESTTEGRWYEHLRRCGLECDPYCVNGLLGPGLFAIGFSSSQCSQWKKDLTHGTSVST